MEDATTFTRQTTFTKAADILPHPSLPPATELARCWRLIHKFKTYLRLDVDIILVYHLQTRTVCLQAGGGGRSATPLPPMSDTIPICWNCRYHIAVLLVRRNYRLDSLSLLASEHKSSLEV
ncbi:hypothetical protein J6590_003004 [Homalodisca vitripennis]|nr:hypothetical protein J6590_003004 [Homalodisca vitripennis]